MKKKIAILGSTGSIGKTLIDIIDKNKKNFEIKLLTANKNYKTLLEYFPDNSKERFKTEALPVIWENKKEFNDLMKKSSDDMIKLASLFEDADDVRAILTQMKIRL